MALRQRWKTGKNKICITFGRIHLFIFVCGIHWHKLLSPLLKPSRMSVTVNLSGLGFAPHTAHARNSCFLCSGNSISQFFSSSRQYFFSSYKYSTFTSISWSEAWTKAPTLTTYNFDWWRLVGAVHRLRWGIPRSLHSGLEYYVKYCIWHKNIATELDILFNAGWRGNSAQMLGRLLSPPHCVAVHSLQVSSRHWTQSHCAFSAQWQLECRHHAKQGFVWETDYGSCNLSVYHLPATHIWSSFCSELTQNQSRWCTGSVKKLTENNIICVFIIAGGAGDAPEACRISRWQV